MRTVSRCFPVILLVMVVTTSWMVVGVTSFVPQRSPSSCCRLSCLSSSWDKHKISMTVMLPAKNKSEQQEEEETGGAGGGGIFQGVKNFFAELDAFMDDASARRLGNGAAFYGKRKSNFYGDKDKNKKENPLEANPLEDYRGPSTAGYFQWMPDENGQMRPVTRMKNRVIERNFKSFDNNNRNANDD